MGDGSDGRMVTITMTRDMALEMMTALAGELHSGDRPWVAMCWRGGHAGSVVVRSDFEASDAAKLAVFDASHLG